MTQTSFYASFISLLYRTPLLGSSLGMLSSSMTPLIGSPVTATNSKPVNASATNKSNTPPPPFLEPRCHPLEPEITREVDGYFIKHWPFPNEKAIQKFRDAGFSRVTCCYYPEALNDRIHFGCRLLTLLFLIDGLNKTSFIVEKRANGTQTYSRTCLLKTARLTTIS